MSLITRTVLLAALALPAAGCEVVQRLELYAQERIDARIDERFEQYDEEDSGEAPLEDTGDASDPGNTEDPGSAEDPGGADHPVNEEAEPLPLAEVTFLNEGPDTVQWIDAETCDGEWVPPIVDQNPLYVGAARSVLMDEGCYRLFIHYQGSHAQQGHDVIMEEMQVLAGEQYLFHL